MKGIEKSGYPSFLPVVYCVNNKVTTRILKSLISLHSPDQNAIQVMIRIASMTMILRRSFERHALSALGFELPNGFKEQKVRGHIHSAVSASQ